MPSIHVFKRKWKANSGQTKVAKRYSAQIRFGTASYLRSTGTANEREAWSIARQIAKEIEEKELPSRGQTILTVEAMFSRWIIEHGKDLRSGKDIKWQIELILELVGKAREIREIGNKDINELVQNAKAKGKGAVTINRSLETFRAVMNYAADRWEEPVRRISWKTFRQKEPKVREVYLSPDEARQLMEILPKHIALAVRFTLYTGMRLNELQTLSWAAIEPERNLAMVQTKGGGTRPVWLSTKAFAIIHELRSVTSNGQHQNRVFDLANRRRHWERARMAIGRKNVNWHDLRGMTATWARQFANQSDLTLIGKALGHSGTNVTERYARVVDQEVIDMLNQLPDVSPNAKPNTKSAINSAISADRQNVQVI